MNDDEITELATYNAERWRGIMHTPEWQERMAQLQERFDWEQRRAAGVPVHELGPPPPKLKLGTTSEIRGVFPSLHVSAQFMAGVAIGATVAYALALLLGVTGL